VSTIYHERVPSSMQGRVFGLRSAIGRGLEPVGSLIAGVVIASVAAPAMADDGPGAATVGRLIGVGEDRGAAAVVLAVGVALALIGIWLLRSWIRADLDGVDPATVGNVDDAVADGTAPIGCPTDPAVTGGG
jgi:DHA3 family macrolide efflux protein-like MFS transporter